MHLFLISLTKDPGLGAAGKVLLCPPVFAAGNLPHFLAVSDFSVKSSALPPSVPVALLDVVVVGRVPAVRVVLGRLLILRTGFMFM